MNSLLFVFLYNYFPLARKKDFYYCNRKKTTIFSITMENEPINITISPFVNDDCFKQKVILLYGARHDGKSTMLKNLSADYLPQIQVIATGSSAFDLRNKTNEPLTEQKWEHYLYPFSFAELVNHTSLLQEKRALPLRLVFGSYPEIVTARDNLERRLKLLVESYLYKDVLLWSGLKNRKKLLTC